MRSPRLFTPLSVLLLLATASPALSQALPAMSRLRLPYVSRKARVNPQGQLKAQIDAIDAKLDAALAAGRTSEVRRLYTMGVTLLDGKAWTPELDYTTSLVLRSDRVVVDPSMACSVRLEQLYVPDIALKPMLSTKVALHKGWALSGPSAPVPALGPAGPLVKPLGSFDGASRDLRAEPYVMVLDIANTPDGDYQIAVTVAEGDRQIGAAMLDVTVVNGLEAKLASLQAAAAKAPEAFRSELLFPADRIRNINQGRLELLTFNAARDLAAASESAKAGPDAWHDKTGDFTRHYELKAASEIVPYRMYVPKAYTPGRQWPLVVALHGNGSTQDAMFDQESGEISLAAVAEQHGYIVLSPLGLRVDGNYGWGLEAPPEDAAVRRIQSLSEQDVLDTIERVRRDYNIDSKRTYLLGHSMGAGGVWRLLTKYPDRWAAVATQSGGAMLRLGGPTQALEMLKRVQGIPVIMIHGTADTVADIENDRRAVPLMKQLGMNVKYVEVNGGGHTNIVAPSFPSIFEFFDANVRKAPTTGR